MKILRESGRAHIEFKLSISAGKISAQYVARVGIERVGIKRYPPCACSGYGPTGKRQGQLKSWMQIEALNNGRSDNRIAANVAQKLHRVFDSLFSANSFSTPFERKVYWELF